jgi:outer membrane murein-binding lipoprotein Lpp
MRKIKCILLGIIASILIVGCASQEEYDQLKSQNAEMEKQIDELQKTITEKDKIIQSLNNSVSSQTGSGAKVVENDSNEKKSNNDGKLEITVENFWDYFEIQEKAFVIKNAFGDFEKVKYFKGYVLKEEYSNNLNYNSSELYVKYLPQGRSVVRVEVDLQNETAKVLEEDNKYLYEDGEKVVKLVTWSSSDFRECSQDIDE